jgi:hypothetical protein
LTSEVEEICGFLKASPVAEIGCRIFFQLPRLSGNTCAVGLPESLAAIRSPTWSLSVRIGSFDWFT